MTRPNLVPISLLIAAFMYAAPERRSRLQARSRSQVRIDSVYVAGRKVKVAAAATN